MPAIESVAPPHPKTPTKLSIELNRLEALCRREALTVNDFLEELSMRSNASFALFLALPFLLPASVPGLSTVLGGMIVLIGTAIMFDRPPWIPSRLRRRRIKLESFGRALAKINPYLNRIEKVLRPRGWFSWLPCLRFSNGLVFVIAGFVLALPLPPGTNLPPALVIVFLSLGIIEEDDLFVTLSYSLLIGGVVSAWWFFDLLHEQLARFF